MVYLTEGKPVSVTEPWHTAESWIRVVKVDTSGAVIFNKIIPDTFFQAVGYGHASRMTNNSYLLSSQLVGLKYEHPLQGLLRYNCLLHNIDENANVIWNRLVNYSNSGLLQEPTSIGLSNGGGAVMWSRDTFGAPPEIKSSFQELNYIDSNGNIIWKHAWLDQSLRFFYRIIAAANGDILGVGTYQNEGKGKGVIFRVSANGELLWERHYSDSIVRPWSPQLELFDITELNDGRIAACGVVFDTNSIGSLNPNIGLLIVGSDGCFEPGCSEVDQVVSGAFDLYPKPKIHQLACIPNPATNRMLVQLPDLVNNSKAPQILRMYDLHGSFVRQVDILSNTREIQLDISNQSSGTYQLLLLQNGQPIASGKIIKN